MWMSMIADGHDICCDCNAPFAHLLDSIFPEGHRDREKTISHIIKRDWKQCHSGGDEDERTGGENGEEKDIQPVKKEEGDLIPEDTKRRRPTRRRRRRRGKVRKKESQNYLATMAT